MQKFSVLKMACIVFVFCVAAAMVSSGQTFTSLFSFDLTDGANLFAGLVQGADGNFYGTAYTGGAYGYGTVFKITAAGTQTTLYSFCSAGWPSCPDGAYPLAGVVQATNGNFYGTTADGGTSGCGTVFKITPAGKLTTLHSFDCTDGNYPSSGGLLQATDGNFYGTTLFGGTNNYGTVFKITPAGKLTTLHSFCSTGLPSCPDGAELAGGLVQATDGNFYGTTDTGGAYGYGTVFKITPAGTLTTLHSFDLTDGNMPVSTLVQASDGSFYGITTWGGANYPPECSNGYGQTGCGTVFKITAAGTLTTLHSFDFVGDGLCPNAGLVLATDGNFYGTTSYGGANGYSSYGTVFSITAAGTLTTLHSFDLTDGANASAVLLQATNGNFYGTTEEGGTSSNCTSGCGTIFSLSVGLGPFVKTEPASGMVGAPVIILGNNLTGTTSVSFNGTAATFTVAKSTEIKTTVPTGATTGKVEVTTPKKTLKSNVAFRVTPQIQSFTPTSGVVGTVVTITGVSLTQTTKVTFGGVKATAFTVNSDTQVTATVPAGAKTGYIRITTPGGTAKSSGTFTVT